MRKYPRLFRRREPEKPPAPKPEPKVRDYTLRLQMDGMKLEWTFASAAERRAFNLGFREGAEYELEGLKRKGVVGPNTYVEFSAIKEPG